MRNKKQNSMSSEYAPLGAWGAGINSDVVKE